MTLTAVALWPSTADDQLVAYDHKGFWQPMDTSREYNLLNRLWDAGDAPWKVW